MVLPLGNQHMRKRKKVNAEGVQVPDANSHHKPDEIVDMNESRDDNDLGVVSNPMEEEPLDDTSSEFNNQDGVAGNVLDEGWTKLHSDELQGMLDFGKHYEIQCSYFTNEKLCLVVNDRISEVLITIYAVDYESDFPHVLTSYICSKKFVELVAKLGWSGLTSFSNKLEGFLVD